MSIWNRRSAWVIGASLAASVALSSCGYHVAGQANLVPKTVHTVAIPPFDNVSVRYKLTDVLPQDISREFISRTSYQVISDPTQADAVLRGSVINYLAFPTLIDTAPAEALFLFVIVVVFSQVSLFFEKQFSITPRRSRSVVILSIAR